MRAIRLFKLLLVPFIIVYVIFILIIIINVATNVRVRDEIKLFKYSSRERINDVFPADNSKSGSYSSKNIQSDHEKTIKNISKLNLNFKKYTKGNLHENLASESRTSKAGLVLFSPMVSEFVVAGPGEMGAAVTLNSSESHLSKSRWKENQFNIVANEKMRLVRTLGDYRDPLCRGRSYPADLPTASLVIGFYNEGLFPLLRTAQSCWMRAPIEMLREVILVDDGSERSELKDKLNRFAAILFPGKVKVIHLAERVGLMGARTVGADASSSDVIVFLDSHCECDHGWLEPLLERIYYNYKTIAVPIIDVIDDDSMAYNPKGIKLYYGEFTWTLMFTWKGIPSRISAARKSPIEPIETPTMPGGLFAIHRKWWTEIGKYDPGLRFWGAENLEMSFKTWLCGGALEFVPCSRIGHIFRRKSPYTGGGQYNNARRVAETWLDEYKTLYYEAINLTPSKNVSIDVADRLIIKGNLGCRPFSWYINKFFGHWKISRLSIAYKDLQTASGMCVAKDNRLLIISECSQSNPSISLTTDGWLKIDSSMCLKGDIKRGYNVVPSRCDADPYQQWNYNATTGFLVNTKTELCLGVSGLLSTLSLDRCTKYSDKWKFMVNYI